MSDVFLRLITVRHDMLLWSTGFSTEQFIAVTTMSDSKSPGGAMVEKVLFVISE